MRILERRVSAPSQAVWVALLIVAAVALLLWPTTALVVRFWSPVSDNVLSHAWLVVAVVAWGLVREAQDLGTPPSTRPAWLPVIVTIAIGLFWALAKHAALLIPQQLLWFALLLAGLWTTFGTVAMRSLLRPLWILGLLMPVWEMPHQFLWFASTQAVKAILGVVGVPAYFEGNVIHLASGSIQIASGCAGLAFFAAAIATAAIIGYLNRASLKQHLVLFAAAAAVAMVSNWLRIVIIVFEAHRTDMQTPLITKDHYVFGWILFAVGLMAYCFAFASYGLKTVSANGGAAAAPVPPMQPTASRPMPWARIVASIAVVSVGPLAVALTSNHHQANAVPAALAADLPGYHPVPVQSSPWYPNFPGADAEVLLQQDSTHNGAFVYANVFLSQTNSRRLIGDGHSVVPEHWQIDSTRSSERFAQASATDPSGQVWLIRYVYVVDGRFIGRPLEAQLRFGIMQFLTSPKIGLLAVAVRCDKDCQSTGSTDLGTEMTWAQTWFMRQR